MAWPGMGWRRTGRYWTTRLKRLQGSPYSIACGFACGAAVSFTPFIGFHFILAAVLAYFLRGHIIASAIGTAVGNPWTFPLIWWVILQFGSFMLGYEGGQELPADLSMSVMFDHLDDILFPMVVGGLPTALAVWLLMFFPIRRLVSNYQHHRRVRRLRRKQVLAEERLAALGEKENGLSEEDEAVLEQDITIPEPGAANSEQDEESYAAAANVTRLDAARADRKR